MQKHTAACARPEEAKERKRASVKNRRGLKGPDYCISSRIQRVLQQLSSEIPTLSEDDSRNKRPACSKPSPPRQRPVPEESDPRMFAMLTSMATCAILHKEKPCAISSFQQSQNCPKHLYKWPVIHCNKKVLSRRVGRVLPCTSVVFASWVFDFHLLTYWLKTFFSCRRWMKKNDTL